MAVGKKRSERTVNNRRLTDNYLTNFFTEGVICFPKFIDLFLGATRAFIIVN